MRLNANGTCARISPVVASRTSRRSRCLTTKTPSRRMASGHMRTAQSRSQVTGIRTRISRLRTSHRAHPSLRVSSRSPSIWISVPLPPGSKSNSPLGFNCTHGSTATAPPSGTPPSARRVPESAPGSTASASEASSASPVDASAEDGGSTSDRSARRASTASMTSRWPSGWMLPSAPRLPSPQAPRKRLTTEHTHANIAGDSLMTPSWRDETGAGSVRSTNSNIVDRN